MTRQAGKILIVDDDADVLLSARMFLKQHFNSVETESDPNLIFDEIRSQNYDAVLLDMNFSAGMTTGKEGLYWLNTILALDRTLPVVMMTAYGDIDLAVKAIKEGAADFVLKPWQNEKLLATIFAALALKNSRQEIKKLKLQQKQLNEYIDKDFSEFIGNSEAIRQVFETIQKVAATNANVLVLGENGTGKELVARALHKQSQRNANQLVSVDLGSIPETLFESELFGHVKGAFTDSKEDRPGRFEIADKGTLFLDEIGNLPLFLQSKLLAVLENRKLSRIGSNTYIDLDIRLISATNMPLYEMVEENKFRQDLLYRINTVEIKLPPLRERDGDIQLLSEYFLGIYGKKYNKPHLKLSKTAKGALEQYEWPGNVRELQHAIERAVILCETGELQATDFRFLISKPSQGSSKNQPHKLGEIEKNVIKKALVKNGGNISHAAKELGLTRAALYRRIEKHGL